jgi:transposase
MCGVVRKYRKFSPKFRNEAVKLLVKGSRPIAQIAGDLCINEGTLRNWVNQYRHRPAGVGGRRGRASRGRR